MEKSLRCAILLIFLIVSVPVYSDNAEESNDQAEVVEEFFYSDNLDELNDQTVTAHELIYLDNLGRLSETEADNDFFYLENPEELNVQAETPDNSIVSRWWDNLGQLNGFRVSIKIGGWNFWHTNDAEYVYSDAIGSIFSGEDGRLYSYPMLGAGARWSPWKFVLINLVLSTSRISLGAGIGTPFGNAGFNITPWIAADMSLTNGIFPVFSFEGGIDLFFNRFLIIGLDFCSSQPFNDKGWKSISYGISFGLKIL